MRGLPRAEPWFLGRFLGGIAAFLGLQALLVAGGTPTLLGFYQQQQTEHLIAEARAVLLDHRHPVDPEILAAGPFLVFDAGGGLVFTNRGQGRSLDPTSLTPVVWEGVAIGQVYTGETSFLTRRANQQFLAALVGLFGLSLLASVVVAWVWARLNSRRLTGLFHQLAADLGALGRGGAVVARPSPFVELDTIAGNLVDLARRLDEAEARQRAFLQDVAHDLRTPLTGLRGQLEALADGVLPPDPERFQRMMAEVDTLGRMANDLSLLLKTDGTSALVTEPVSLVDLVRDLGFRVEAEVRRRALVWQTEVAPLTLRVDPALVGRALANLVDNALEHGRGLTTLGVSAHPEGAEAVILVTNDGEVVAPEVRARMFDRHWRGDPGRSGSGSGLGLAIARSIAERHGGRLEAEAPPTGGLRLVLRLPLA